MDIVDAIGGIDIELSDDEIKVLNDYLGEVNMILGVRFLVYRTKNHAV